VLPAQDTRIRPHCRALNHVTIDSLPMPHLEPDPFLNELNKLYEANKDKGSVWVTFKRKEWKPNDEKKDATDSKEKKDDKVFF
jgi:hypothetical protein